jgi:hypothetical protein
MADNITGSVRCGATKRKNYSVFSDRRDDEFVDLAERAIIRAQIEARFFWFDASQHQRPAAFGARGPEIIDELKIKRVCHGTDNQRLCRPDSESIPQSKTGHCTENDFWV